MIGTWKYTSLSQILFKYADENRYNGFIWNKKIQKSRRITPLNPITRTCYRQTDPARFFVCFYNMCNDLFCFLFNVKGWDQIFTSGPSYINITNKTQYPGDFYLHLFLCNALNNNIIDDVHIESKLNGIVHDCSVMCGILLSS